MAGLAKNAAGQALCDDRLCPQNRPAICSLRNFVALLVPFLAPQFLRLQVEGYEIFIKFLPPSATGDTLKAFFSEARDSRSPDLSRSLQTGCLVCHSCHGCQGCHGCHGCHGHFRFFQILQCFSAGWSYRALAAERLLDYGMFISGKNVFSSSLRACARFRFLRRMVFVAEVGEPRIMLDSRTGSFKAQGVLGSGVALQAVKLTLRMFTFPFLSSVLDLALALALLLPLAVTSCCRPRRPPGITHLGPSLKRVKPRGSCGSGSSGQGIAWITFQDKVAFEKAVSSSLMAALPTLPLRALHDHAW